MSNMYSFGVAPPGDITFQSPTYKRSLSENKENMPGSQGLNNDEVPVKKILLTPRHELHASVPQIPSDSPYRLAKFGRIQLICGPMFSGKSTELLRKMRVFEVALHKSLIVKYAKDDRFSDDCVSTHDKTMRKAVKATKLEQIRAEALKYTIIGIDEGQFFDDLVPFCVDMANRGKTVLVAALDGTFEQKPFANTIELISNCESVVKLSSVCMSCLKQASFSRRLNDDKRVEVIGGEDVYAASCRRCLLLPPEVFKQQIEIRAELKRSQSMEFPDADSQEGLEEDSYDRVNRRINF